MNSQNLFTELAGRVRRGEPGAAGHFRREILPQLENMVRWDIRGRSPGPWHDAIRREMQRALSRSHPAADEESLTGVVAQRLCDRMIDNLQAQGRKLYPLPPAAAMQTIAC